MKIKAPWFTLLIFFFLASKSEAQYVNRAVFNAIRICYIPDFPWPSPIILQRCKDNKYNYALVEFNLNWSDGAPATPHPLNPDPGKPLNRQPIAALTSIIRNAFQTIDSYGMRMIPLVQIGNGHAYQWNKVAGTPVGNPPAPEFPAIQMTEFSTANGTIGMPSLAPDPNGIDAAYLEYLRVLLDAYTQSSVSYPLEFIHLGYDEIQFGNKLLLGGAENGPAVNTGDKIPIGNINTVRISSLDRNFIASYVGTRAQAYSALINQSIVRRIGYIKKIIGPFAKAMVYGDMYDSELNGGYAFKDYAGNPVILGAPLRALEGLNDSEKGYFRANVIFGMWSWGYTDLDANGGDYATQTTLQEMANAGFNFIYHVQNAQPASPAPRNVTSCGIGAGVTGCNARMIAQTNEYYNSCKNKFSGSCMGYGSMPFVGAGGVGWTEGNHPAHTTIQYMGALNAGDIPARDFHDPFIVPKLIMPMLLNSQIWENQTRK